MKYFGLILFIFQIMGCASNPQTKEPSNCIWDGAQFQCTPSGEYKIITKKGVQS